MARRHRWWMVGLLVVAACGDGDPLTTTAGPESTAAPAAATATAPPSPTPTAGPTASPTATPSPGPSPTSTPEPRTTTASDIVDEPASFVEALGGGLELWCPPVSTIRADVDSFAAELLPLGVLTPEDEAELALGLARWFSPPDADGAVEVVEIGPTIVVPHRDGAIVARLIGPNETRVDVALHMRRTSDGWAGTWLRACSGIS